MPWHQQSDRIFLSARAKHDDLRLMLSEHTVVPATSVELIRVHQRFAPVNAAGRRAPGASDTTTVTPVLEVPLEEAVALLSALGRAIGDASAQITPAMQVAAEAEFASYTDTMAQVRARHAVADPAPHLEPVPAQDLRDLA